MAFTTELYQAMPNPGKRKAHINNLPHVRAARLRACGSGAAAVAAASEGGTAEMNIEDALSLADEAQRQLEADAAEMNAEMNAKMIVQRVLMASYLPSHQKPPQMEQARVARGDDSTRLLAVTPRLVAIQLQM